MDRNNRKEKTSSTSRRNVLKLGVSSLAGLEIIGSATGSSSNGLTEVNVIVIKQFQPEGDYFKCRQRVVGRELQDIYGVATLNYEPEPIPRPAIPEEYKNPDRPFTIRYQEEKEFGTAQEALEYEQNKSNNQSYTAQYNESSRSPQYDGPAWTWNKTEEYYFEKTAPINVAWGEEMDRSAYEIKSYMQSDGWEKHWTMPGSGNRGIFANDGFKEQDCHIYKEIELTKQYHIRAYDYSTSTDYGDIAVIGQVHRDPYDHNQIGDDPWHFNTARTEVVSDWRDWGYDDTYLSTNSYAYDTHDGYLNYIQWPNS